MTHSLYTSVTLGNESLRVLRCVPIAARFERGLRNPPALLPFPPALDVRCFSVCRYRTPLICCLDTIVSGLIMYGSREVL